MIRGTAILAALALAAVAAQAQLRTIPADAKRGTLSHVQETIVLLDGKQARLSQGAQIRDQENRILVPTQLPKESKVKYLPDAAGHLHRIWIMTPQEAAQPDAKK
jgi:aerobic-type carbon monoxide dehydrogenase small subunit (CoxS/CutS family)